MSFEETLSLVVEAKLSPLRIELGKVAQALEELRRAIPPQLVTIPEAARRLGLSESTVRRRIKDGGIPVVRLGRSVRINLAALHAPTDAEVESIYAELRKS